MLVLLNYVEVSLNYVEVSLEGYFATTIEGLIKSGLIESGIVTQTGSL